jgi:DNA-binding transcriptional LysR family regulator
MQAKEDLRWDDVRLFLVLFRGRSLNRAAAELGIDASTVSRRLAAFEELVDTPLFDRTRVGMLPTTAAEELVPAAEAAESNIRDLAASMLSFERKVEGSVRITAPPGFVELFLAPQLAVLLARHPGLRIEIDTSQQLLDLTRREADIALRTVKPSSGDLVITHFASSEYRPVATPAYAAELGTLKRWSDARFIAWGKELSHIPPARWLEKHLDGTEPVLRTSSLPAQVAAARSGLGVALLPEQIARLFALEALRVSRKLGKDAGFPREDLWLVGHRALRRVPRVDAVWQFLLELGRAR